MAPPRIFVSYSHQDDVFTQRLVADLRTAGVEVWYDVSSIDQGDFMKRIDEALRQCEWLVLVLTPSSIVSPYVQMEVNAALHRVQQGWMRAVIPMAAAPCAPNSIPALWDVLHRYDATQSYQAALSGVLHAVGQEPITAIPIPAATLPLGRFPARLAQLGFDGRVIAGVDVIVPPLCAVPAGEFLMGPSKYEQGSKQKRVTLPLYQIGRYPVTVAEYACFVRNGHVEPPNWQQQLSILDHPVVNVSWYDAIGYAAWLASLTGQPWRLPTRAEWEKAASWDADSGHKRNYPWGDTFDKNRCNSGGNPSWFSLEAFGMIKGTTTPVGAFAEQGDASPCGAHDMVGNVWEWVTIDGPYDANRERELVNASASFGRHVLGGSWKNTDDQACATAMAGELPTNSGAYLGFRLARNGS